MGEFIILFVHREYELLIPKFPKENHHNTMGISGIRNGIDEPLDDLDPLCSNKTSLNTRLASRTRIK